MDHLVPVAVLDGADHLLEELAGLFFWEPTVFNNVVEQLSAGVLQDHYYLGWGLNHSIAVKYQCAILLSLY